MIQFVDNLEEIPGLTDPLYEEAVSFVLLTGSASPAKLQRRFHIGYVSASRLLEAMEGVGLLAPMDSKGHRKLTF